MCLGNTRHWLLADSGSGLRVCPRGYWDVVAGSVSLVAAFLDGRCWAGLAWGWHCSMCGDCHLFGGHPWVRGAGYSLLNYLSEAAARYLACLSVSGALLNAWGQVGGGRILLAVPPHLRKTNCLTERVGYNQNWKD